MPSWKNGKRISIDGLQSQLVLSVARNGQQLGIIEQIGKLTEAYHSSVHADDDQSLTRQ